MRRSSSFLHWGLALSVMLCSPAAFSQAVDISGQSSAIIIDTDNNGPGGNDCVLEVFYTEPLVTILGLESPSSTIRFCTGDYSGSMLFGQDESSDWAEVLIDNVTTDPSGGTTPPPAFSDELTNPIPFQIEFIAEAFPPPPPDGLPMEVNEIEFENPPGDIFAEAFLCNADGPSAQLQFLDGSVNLLFPLEPYPNSANPTHYALEDLPFERASPNSGTFVMHDMFFPVDGNGAYTVTLPSGQLFMNVHPDDFPTCSGPSISVPMLKNGGLAFIALLLAAMGYLVLRTSGRTT